MTPPLSVGRLVAAGVSGPDLSSEEIAALRELGPSAVILFARNLRSSSQTADLVAGIRESSALPLLLAIDQEGGRVNRLRAIHPVFDRLPPGRVQAGWDLTRLEQVWFAVGGALAALGFDVDFHPIVDLDDSPGINAIGDRSFGVDAGHVTAVAAAILDGLEAAGIAACLKHFPGLGGSDLDTHVALASSPVPADLLWRDHVRPYRELARRVPLVMTAHAHYRSVDGEEPIPATFSRRLVGEWLRERVGYEGVVVSDDLEMGAVSDRDVDGAAAVAAIEAGCDLLLYCHDLARAERARIAIAARAENDAPFRTRVEDACARVRGLARRWAGEPPRGDAEWSRCRRELARVADLVRAASLRRDRAR